jgi:RNA polymerase sigma factor (sigma-70 family)
MDNRPQIRSAVAQRRAEVLDQLLRDHRNQLLNQVRFHSPDADQAEEALADACVQFMRFWDDPPGVDPLPWLLVVAKRCAWAIARKDRRRRSRLGAASIESACETAELAGREAGPGPQEMAERSAETERLIELIEELKPDERTALILLGLGCSYAEIAELRGWSPTKV